MFGTEESTQEIVRKRRKTSRQRYGYDHPMQNDEVKAHQQAVLTEKYGAPVPLQNPEILAKMRKTVEERYGVSNVAMIPSVQEKMTQTTLERYGVKHFSQLPEAREYLRQHCPEWLKESWESGGPMKGITRPEEWNEKQSRTVLDLMERGEWNVGPKYSVNGTYQSTKCRKSEVIFRSSYELKAYFFLDHCDEVDWYDYEPFQIQYQDTEGKKRHYVVDFVIKLKGHDKLVAVEVKNNYTKDSVRNKSKYQAFREQCSIGLDLEIWANEDIASLKIDLEQVLKDPRVKLWKSE